MSRTEIQACESGAPVRPNFEVPNFEVRDIPRLMEGELKMQLEPGRRSTPALASLKHNNEQR
jgi:hypothetical protein